MMAAQEAPRTLFAVSQTLEWSPALLTLLSAMGGPRAYWRDAASGTTHAAFGAAAEVRAAGPERFETIQAEVALWSTRVQDWPDQPLKAPRWFGGFGFTPAQEYGIWSAFPPAYFFLPAVQVALASHGMCTVTVIGEEQPAALQAALASWLSGATEAEGSTPPAAVTGVRWSTIERWRSMVNDVQAGICAGHVRKVVLARSGDVQFDAEVEPAALLEVLAARYPECTTFLIGPRAGSAFFGATPEVLIDKRGCALRTVALAGSRRRGVTPEEDRALGEELLASPKEREEHALVVEDVRARLLQIADDMHIPDTPELMRLSNIQHLHTPIQAVLRQPEHVLSLVSRFHPTPALGGEPREAAVRMLAHLEAEPRGWYAAPVGWFDQQGDGQFVVAIRSAVCAGREVRVYAGAGIVAGSDADAEWAETMLKFRPMLQALGVPS